MRRFDTDFQKTQFKRFARLCDRNSPPLVMILKAHLLAESLLDTFISSFLRRGDQLVKDGRLTFSQKVTFFEATDLGPVTVSDALRALNKIRNRLAHDAETDVMPSDVRALCGCFGDYFQKRQYRDASRDELLYVALILTVSLLSHLCEEAAQKRDKILGARKKRLTPPR
jgi:hypothetical protein